MISQKQVSIAMAVAGINEWNKRQKRHWVETARACGAGSMMTEIITEVLEQLPGVIDRTSGQLPESFPKKLSRSLFEGMQKTALRLE
jgi:serine/threonine-protein kinase HipA